MLNLENNNLRNAGANYLLEVLIDNKFIEQLNLSMNHISDAENIAKLLKNSSCLLELYLHYN